MNAAPLFSSRAYPPTPLTRKPELMSNESPVSAATSAANPITAEAVAAWLVAQAAALEAAGQPPTA